MSLKFPLFNIPSSCLERFEDKQKEKTDWKKHQRWNLVAKFITTVEPLSMADTFSRNGLNHGQNLIFKNLFKAEVFYNGHYFPSQINFCPGKKAFNRGHVQKNQKLYFKRLRTNRYFRFYFCASAVYRSFV